MKEILTMIPLFLLAIAILVISNYFLKKNQLKKESESYDGEINTFGKFMHFQTKYFKIFAKVILGFMFLKVLYILFFK